MIQINDLTFSYSGGMPYILNNINLNIPKGSFTSIIGENGSAKTTLLKLLLGILTPLKGDITIEKCSIGYVAQKVDGFNSSFPITVYELLKVHCKTIGIKSSSSIDSILDYVNMKDFKNSLVGSLSGGQQQRVFIAKALLGEPDLLMLDELSSGVDEKNQIELYALLQRLNREKGLTILSVDHNITRALEYSTHVIDVKDFKASLYELSEYETQREREVL
ncbi:metal ABC transporter ATP-binding protein [Clostridium sp. 'White wine YQ']|uniref:metal ABC transporter ATP-binding protein n=1 Tax=Clostridium sp. 'White wine YQ' TaxID=3027474 RepID=UPI0023668E39|nr:ATP-binding cassette domain-containing protein [Clostridium sp. 'White wine YQ']MDD7792929.1 ATP-binding cassette domain-containing protein [Clostridium sp. 'White wine YQ']